MTPTEWAGIIGAFAMVLGPVTAVLVAVLRLRAENTRQHNENRAAVDAKFDEVRDDLRHVNQAFDKRMDKLEDSVVDAIDRHESVHHRRWWRSF